MTLLQPQRSIISAAGVNSSSQVKFITLVEEELFVAVLDMQCQTSWGSECAI